MVILKDIRILVTGGTGFLGSYILRQLIAEGFTNVMAVKRNSSRLGLVQDIGQKVKWVDCDISDYTAMDNLLKNIDCIIHAAAMVSFVPKDKVKMHETNADATAQLVNLALSHNIKKLVYISSVAALGRSEANQVIDENQIWIDSKYNSEYAKSKQYGEREVWRGHAEGLPVAIINPSYILGAGYWKDGATSLYDKIYNGMRFYPTGMNGVVDVRDVAKMTVRVLDQDINGERIIACAQNVSHKDLFSKIATAFSKRPPSQKVTPLLGWAATTYESLKSIFTNSRPIVTKETIRTSNHVYKYDNRKSISLLDFRYRDIDKSIQAICKSYIEAIRKGEDYGRIYLS